MTGLISDSELTFVFHRPGKSMSGFCYPAAELVLCVDGFETVRDRYEVSSGHAHELALDQDAFLPVCERFATSRHY
jgi:hypothetical protein